MGQAQRLLFKGSPPSSELSDAAFPNVRHVLVPPWTPHEFHELIAKSKRLDEVLRASPDKLRQLAMVPFNTSLLADLVASGAVSEDFKKIDSQIMLMDLYWQHRIERHGVAAEVLLRDILATMVGRRALRAPRLEVAARDPHTLEKLTADGVLVPVDQDRSIQFRHHLLFDYAASRVFLNAEAIISGKAVFPKADALGLMLAPAMAFLLRGLWSADIEHDRFWIATSWLLGAEDCDPVIRSMAARMAAELPETSKDIAAFASRTAKGEVRDLAALSHIAGAVAVRLEDASSSPTAPWVDLALELAENPQPVAAILRMLSFLLTSRATDMEERIKLGIATRQLLAYRPNT